MNKIFVISGPSGSGKTTLLNRLIKDPELKGRVVKSVSLTTRPRRSGERQGRDYFFVSPEEFRLKLKAGKILERTRYLGYDYATPKEFIRAQLDKAKSLLLCLDLKGARRIKRFYPKNSVTIFILPPSLKVLQERIKRRGDKTKKEEFLLRLRQAKKELAVSGEYDYRVLNKNLKTAQARLKKIILKELMVY
ncbi:MAG: guanylate kinase [Candidatus Omnitrophica bacterium]|nr:guanylate kinase [Candidatus Omnitrophota bacterium]